MLRAYWDGEAAPSIEVPVGDFFGVGHAQTRNFSALPLQMSPEDGKGFNCWFPMPFASAARITATSECSSAEVLFYYYIDYEELDALPDGLGYFHAQWRREDPTDGIDDDGVANEEYEFRGHNSTGAGNYIILEATGPRPLRRLPPRTSTTCAGRETVELVRRGRRHDLRGRRAVPARLHGTGTEDYFNTAWCPTQEYQRAYHGITMPGGPNWSGKISLYRFHIEDPVRFRESIRVTIEHGHANRRIGRRLEHRLLVPAGAHMPRFRGCRRHCIRLPHPDEGP